MIKFIETSDASICIYDPSGRNRNHIRNMLKAYKTRWGESLANRIAIVHDLTEAPQGAHLIIPAYSYEELTHKTRYIIHTITSTGQLTEYDLRKIALNVEVRTTKDYDEAKQWLEDLPDVVTYDCETTGLEHPSREELTMVSFGISETEAIVIINEDKKMQDMLMDFLTTTERKLIIHNASFDLKWVKYLSGKYPKNYEDSSLLVWTLKNHTQTYLAKVGLKGLAGAVYSQWAVAPDLFSIEHKYSPELHYYAGVDAAATWFVWNEYRPKVPEVPHVELDDLLPVGMPTDPTQRQSRGFFYENVAKPLIPHIVDIMLQGITLDQTEIENLRNTIDEMLETVHNRIEANPIIQKFQQYRYKQSRIAYIEEQRAKQRDYRYYLKDYDPKSMEQRSYILKITMEHIPDLEVPELDYLPNGEYKCTIKVLKEMILLNPDSQIVPFFQSIIDKTVDGTHEYIREAISTLAMDKAALYNRKYKDNISAVTIEKLLGKFNPGSSQQKAQLFSYLGIECEKFSKDTGEPSWDRDQVERVNRETLDDDVKDFTQAFIDYSFSAIIRNNFLSAFDRFSINGTLHGNLRIGGAKSFRLTSDKPNLLNMPSSRSIYAKPLKKCLVAPEGFVVATADFAALEDRVIASITGDETKVKIMNEHFDSHCVNAAGYFKEQVEAILGPDDGSLEWNQSFKAGCATNPTLKKLRSDSKAPTFGLAYGAMAPKVASSLKIPLAEAQQIYDRYHNVLYSGIAVYTKEYVLTTARMCKEVYLGLGLSIKTNSPDSDIRTLHNATIQFWSVLTLLALARVNERIQEAGLTEDIQCVSTIYDSIYYNCRANPTTIQWLNKVLTEEMARPFLTEQLVQNEADMEIGPNWANLTELSHDATEDDIQQILNTF